MKEMSDLSEFWENDFDQEMVRYRRLADGGEQAWVKRWGSETEISIEVREGPHEQVRLGGSAISMIDEATYQRGRLLPNRDLYSKAVAFAIEHHDDQRRRDANHTPYLAHLIGVSSLALEDGATPPESIAALLHDTLEDCRTVSEELLTTEFGEDICRMVVGCTDRLPGDEPHMRWKDRKTRYLEHLAAANDDVLLVSNADKLHNLMSFVGDFQTTDPATVMGRFRNTEGLRWNYTELGNIFAHRRPNTRNQQRFARNLTEFLAAIA